MMQHTNPEDGYRDINQNDMYSQKCASALLSKPEGGDTS